MQHGLLPPHRPHTALSAELISVITTFYIISCLNPFFSCGAPVAVCSDWRPSFYFSVTCYEHVQKQENSRSIVCEDSSCNYPHQWKQTSKALKSTATASFSLFGWSASKFFISSPYIRPPHRPLNSHQVLVDETWEGSWLTESWWVSKLQSVSQDLIWVHALQEC